MKENFSLSRSARGIFIAFDYLRAALIIVVALLLIYYLIIQVFIVQGVSMDPNFEDRELIVVNRLNYYFENPSRGESIVFVFPGTRNDKYIKRIIALPNETIEISGGKIKINGEELKEDYIPNDFETLGEVKTKLKSDEFFVLGDNRELSNDSRIWGALSRNQIIGKAQVIFYPFSKFKWLEQESYNL